MGRKKYFARYVFSVAPTGAFFVVKLDPQLALWATGVHCSAAFGGGRITAKVFRGAADGRDSNGSRRRHWCLQKQIAASVIRRGRRKKPRWRDIGGMNKLLVKADCRTES
jgi:hypothetical protein